MRFLIFGCLHGQLPKAHYTTFDAIIAPGDFCSDAHRAAMFAAIKHNQQHPKTPVNWYDLVGKKEAKRLILQSLADGKKVLRKLDSFGVPVYVVPGNNDWCGENSLWAFERQNHYKTLLRGHKNIIDLHEKSLDIGNYILIGRGISSGPEYPQYNEDKRLFTARELNARKNKYLTLKKKMMGLVKHAKKPVILVFHNVPFNTPIDLITWKQSPRVGQHFGSLLLRELILETHPIVTVGAHMHEHFRAVPLAKTICINAGYGKDCNVLLELNGKIKTSFKKGK